VILFVTGTGTGVGKTAVATSLTQLLDFIGVSVASVKPLETGCEPHPSDAIKLAAACKQPALSDHPAFYRARAALSPYAATLAGEPSPNFEAIVHACQALAVETRLLIVEGAGGLLVPLDRARSMADLALALGSKLLLVAPDRLGVLSDVLAAVECAERRGLTLLAIVLNRGVGPTDASREHNARILRERCSIPVVTLDAATDGDGLDAMRQSGLLDVLGLAR
jgi:dethiobiotin synthetase